MSTKRIGETSLTQIPTNDIGNVLAKTYVGIGLGTLTIVGWLNERVAPVAGFDSLPTDIQNSAGHVGIGYLGAWSAYAAYDPAKKYLSSLKTHKTNDFFTHYLDSRDLPPLESIKTIDTKKPLYRHLIGIGTGLWVNLAAELIQAKYMASPTTSDVIGDKMLPENTRDAAAALLGTLLMAFMARRDHERPLLNLPKHRGVSYH